MLKSHDTTIIDLQSDKQTLLHSLISVYIQLDKMESDCCSLTYRLNQAKKDTFDLKKCETCLQTNPRGAITQYDEQIQGLQESYS